jgi:excisionase family DNA binding protein
MTKRIAVPNVAPVPSEARRRPSEQPNAYTPKLAYSVAEACAAIGISRPTMYVLMERGQLRTVKIGGRRLIPATELERLIADAS